MYACGDVTLVDQIYIYLDVHIVIGTYFYIGLFISYVLKENV
jgi:hypothetical protein